MILIVCIAYNMNKNYKTNIVFIALLLIIFFAIIPNRTLCMKLYKKKLKLINRTYKYQLYQLS